MPKVDGIFRTYADETNLADLGIVMEPHDCEACGKTFQRMKGSSQAFHSEVCRTFEGKPAAASKNALNKERCRQYREKMAKKNGTPLRSKGRPRKVHAS